MNKMPVNRKESPSSHTSAGSSPNQAPVSDNSSGDAIDMTSSTPKTNSTKNNSKMSRTASAESDGSNSSKSSTLPPVKKAFKHPDSAASSVPERGPRLDVGNGPSRLSVRTLNSGARGSETFGSSYTLNTARPEYEVNLVAPLQKEHECPVCYQVLRYPVQFDCKHHCCSSCLPDLLRVEPRCPIDQTKIERDKVIIDKVLQKELDNLTVYCCNADKGCIWAERMKDLAAHLSDCPYATILCPNHCEAEFQRRFMDQHVTSDCPLRPIGCEYCSEVLVAEQTDAHRETCPRIPVPCPNGCKYKEIPRNEIPQHLLNKCSRQIIQCSFAPLGCNHECKRKELSDHNKEYTEHHMGLVAAALAEYKKTFDMEARTLQAQTDKLAMVETRLESLEKLYGAQLVWKIDNYCDRLEDARQSKKNTIYSPPFFTHRNGYKMVCSACLNGDGNARGRFMSVFICICRGEYDPLLSWPFNHRITFTLVDQSLDPAARRNITHSIKPNNCKENKPFLGRPTTDRNASLGCQRFADMDILTSRDYIRDDVMFITVVIDNDDVETL